MFRTHNLSKRAAAGLRLRSRGHWDRLLNNVVCPNTEYNKRFCRYYTTAIISKGINKSAMKINLLLHLSTILNNNDIIHRHTTFVTENPKALHVSAV